MPEGTTDFKERSEAACGNRVQSLADHDAGGSPYAGAVTRGLAFAVDCGVVVLAAGLSGAVIQILRTALNLNPDPAPVGPVVAWPLVLLVGYCVVCWTLAGRTLGMALLGIRLSTVDGGRPRLGRSLVRALTYAVVPVLVVCAAWILVDPRRQGLHDRLTRTVVRYQRIP